MKRLDYLDSIRGIAALIVAYVHIFRYYVDHSLHQYATYDNFLSHFNWGRFGVILFFISSGFVIPWSIRRSANKPILLFWTRRFFRLFPLYWAAIILWFLFARPLMDQDHSVSTIIVNFTMLQSFLGFDNVMGVFWTLQAEMIFYGLVTLLFLTRFLFKTNTNVLFALGFALVALVAASSRYFLDIRIPVVYPLGLSCMFIGALLKEWFIDKEPSSKPKVIISLTAFFVLLPVTCTLYYSDGWYAFLLPYLSAFLLFIAAISFAKIETKAVVYMGTISYSVYLIHPIIIELYFHYTGEGFGVFADFVIYTILVILVTSLTYRFIEKPAISLGQKLSMHFK